MGHNDTARHVSSGAHRFVRNSLILISVQPVTRILGLILFVFVARILGAEEFGFFSSATALAALFALAPDFGFNRLAEREVGRDPGLLYSRFREVNTIKAMFGLVASFLLFVYLMATGAEAVGLVMLIAAFKFLMTFFVFNTALFRGVGRPEFEMLSSFVFSVINLTLGLTVLYLGWGLRGIAASQFVSVCIALLLAYVLIRMLTGKAQRGLRVQTLLRHVKASAPFAGMAVILFFGNQINVLLISALAGNTATGYYAAAIRLFENMTLIPAAIMGAFVPAMSQHYCTSVSRFVLTLRFTLKYLFIISAPIAVGTVIIADPLIQLIYGDEYHETAFVLQIVMSSLVFVYWNFACSSVLIARNREKTLLWFYGVQALVYIAANVILVPLYAHIGAASAFLSSRIILLMVLAYFTRRYISLTKLLRIIFMPGVCVAIMGIAVFLALQHSLWLALVVGIVIYPALLLLTRSVSKSDLDNLRGIMQARR